MKRKFTFLLTAVLLLTLNLTSWGQTYTWNLVTDADTLAVGDVVIIAASDYDVAISTTQNGNNRGQAAITKDTDAETCSWETTAGVQELLVGAGTTSDTWSFF